MKLYSGACERNRIPIQRVLSRLFLAPASILEIASGTGMHAAYLAETMPHVVWQPSDVSPEALASITAWREDSGLSNLQPPIRVDVSEPNWSTTVSSASFDGIFNANMVHIAPWVVAQGVFQGSANLLESGEPLMFYGPFRFDGGMSESNQHFHESLVERDPRWGIRDIEAMCAEAESAGFLLDACHALPANNHFVVFRRT